ncbi:Barstar (barnase inhibitor) [Sinomicrobium oceani]|uniref:Barstar (Barnase inhibitor) n=1 Tax=Sinomicrobium oceani TaxID=1150368 RepID=A0A1K1QJ94_9FLAO|nr:barstar family protein [Sinomicrobium oceani]SFW59286.1 Barstar (barnase inhibitor) [Sinomicrobium oceani]
MHIKNIDIQGRHIHDIPSFYEEINRVFMAGEDWKIGESLDALDDILYGGTGKISGNEPVKLTWYDFDKSRLALGMDTTVTWYREKLRYPEKFNSTLIRERLTALENGQGQTFFDIVMEIIALHTNITLHKH